MGSLEPISASEAKELYLTSRSEELRDKSIEAHNYRLSHFVRWAEETDVENLNALTGRRLHEYRLWRRDDGDLNKVSVQTQLSTLRQFIKFCETIDAVENGLHEKISLPTVSANENSRDVLVDEEEAEQILAYFEQNKYATRRHALFYLLWRIGCRIGAARSIDLDDLLIDRHQLRLRHQPNTDTPLKNGEGSERNVNLVSSQLRTVLADYIRSHRHDVVDEYGREPLFTTQYGRAHKTTLREDIYYTIQPCRYTHNCPHDRTEDNCEARQRKKGENCPSAKSPHAIRRGAITRELKDKPQWLVSQRMDVGGDVLTEHYDRTTEEDRCEKRRGFFDDEEGNE